MISSLGTLLKESPGIYNEQIVPMLNRLSDQAEMITAAVNPQLAQQIEAAIQDFTQNLGTYISDLSIQLVKLISQIIAGIPGLIIPTVITIVATFFMTIDYQKIHSFFEPFISEEKRAALKRGKNYVKNILWIYLRSYTFLFLLTFAELFAGFLILRIPYALILSIAIAIFDILPVLGTGGILIPWAVILVVLKNVPLAAGIMILYLFILIVRNMLEPRIVGKQIGLHPLATLAAMFLGLGLFGIIGMLAFPVALTVIYNLKIKKEHDTDTQAAAGTDGADRKLG